MRRRSFLLASGALAGCQGVPNGAPPAAPTSARSGPRMPAGPLQRIAFGSCIDQTQPQPIWRALRAQHPDLMLFCGDNVYASEQPWQRSRLDAAYAQLAANADFAALRREVPALAIWDDHDYGLNDGGAEFSFKASSKAAFLDFWQVPSDSDRRFRDGLYMAQSIGPEGRRVQVILLDTRWFRSPLKRSPKPGAPGMERYLPDPDPSKTMLGPNQWRWLERRLSEQADVRVLVSSIQVLAEGHGWERWGNLPLERQRLFDTLARTRANGVVVVSGDRHIGGIYREAAGLPYALTEVTSSGITHVAANNREAGPNRIGAPVTELHFGLIDIDWAARALTLSLRGLGGPVLREQRVALDALRAG